MRCEPSLLWSFSWSVRSTSSTAQTCISEILRRSPGKWLPHWLLTWNSVRLEHFASAGGFGKITICPMQISPQTVFALVSWHLRLSAVWPELRSEMKVSSPTRATTGSQPDVAADEDLTAHAGVPPESPQGMLAMIAPGVWSITRMTSRTSPTLWWTQVGTRWCSSSAGRSQSTSTFWRPESRSRHSRFFRHRMLLVTDNMVTACILENSRSRIPSLNALCKRAFAYQAAVQIQVRLRYLETDRNPADGPPRLMPIGWHEGDLKDEVPACATGGRPHRTCSIEARPLAPMHSGAVGPTSYPRLKRKLSGVIAQADLGSNASFRGLSPKQTSDIDSEFAAAPRGIPERRVAH